MGIAEAILVGASLCADCFAVSLCSSVTIGSLRWHKVLRVAAAFALIQSGLLVLGWLLGELVAPLIITASHILGFLLLLFVGGSMLVEGIRGSEEVRRLDSWRNIILGGIATSIDAFAIGAAQSLEDQSTAAMIPLLVSVFGFTALSVVLGIIGGKAVGNKAGRTAEIAGGLVLIGIGISILLR